MASKTFIVTDKIVSDALESVENYRKTSDKNRLVVNGGIATQLYVQPHFPYLLRPTHDLDIEPNPRLSAETFRSDVGKIIGECLKSYNPGVSILRHVYEVKIEDERKYPFFVHLYKYSANGYERNRKNLERATSDANRIKIPNSDESVHVIRPEEIIAGKGKRVEKIANILEIPEEFKDIYNHIRKKEWEKLDEKELVPVIISLVRQKELLPAQFDRGEEEFKKKLDEYRISKDIFDIGLLTRLAATRKVEFDEKYYEGIIVDIK